MQIEVNGQTADCPDDATLAGVLDQLGYGERRVAVEHNGEIVTKADYASTRVSAGDRLEIVHAIGGGQAELPTLQKL